LNLIRILSKPNQELKKSKALIRETLSSAQAGLEFSSLSFPRQQELYFFLLIISNKNNFQKTKNKRHQLYHKKADKYHRQLVDKRVINMFIF
jgi:hypothetical protein